MKSLSTIVTVLFAGAVLSLMLSCSQVTFDNPLDPKGTSYIGDSLAVDTDSDGIADILDPDSPNFQNTDTLKPVMTLIGRDTVIIANGDPTRALDSIGVRAIDNNDGDISLKVATVGAFFSSQCSTFPLLYTVADSAGNTASIARVIIVDCEAPLLTLAGDNPLFLAAGGTYAEPGFTAVDAIDGNVAANVIKTGTTHTTAGSVDTLTYTVVDRVGNRATKTRVVKVEGSTPGADHVPPVITVKGPNPVSIRKGLTYLDSGATARDNVDGDITAKIVTVNHINTAVPGLDSVIYMVKDSAGNADTAWRVVRVLDPQQQDTVLPVITMIGSETMNLRVGDTFIDSGVTAIDNVDGNITARVTKSGTVDMRIAETYMIVYSVSDAAGNQQSAVRTVYVTGVNRDTIKPVITLEGAAICSVGVGLKYIEKGAVATDNNDGAISSRIVRTIKNAGGTTVDTATFTGTMGTYTVTYAVSDAAANAAIPVNRTVVVIDTVGGPILGLLAKYSVPANAPLASINTSYTTVTVEGTGGPNLSNVTTFQFNWDLANKGLYSFAVNTSNGTPDYYVSLLAKVTHTFDQAQPAFTLTGSGFAGLDGAYYIATSATYTAWVKKDGSFAVVFK